MSFVNTSPVSRPFVISAVVLLFIGSGIGAFWAMSINGIHVFSELVPFLSLHRTLQLDGFLTLLIMGVGYMIIPRFRNVLLPKKKMAYSSYLLVIASIALSFGYQFNSNQVLFWLIHGLHLVGILIFVSISLWVIRLPPKLLRSADYFILVSIITIVSLFVVESVSLFSPVSINPLLKIQTWLLFPILMIFGVEFKTVPSFLGFIRPKKRLGNLSIVLAFLSSGIAILALISSQPSFMLLFNVLLLGCSVSLSASLNIFGGFDNSEIKRLFSEEKKTRYQLTELLTRLSFVMLFGGILFSIGSYLSPENFAFYDLAIHYIAIGFIGLSIMLYLPLMLPPIINKTIHFRYFNKIPLGLVIVSLGIRTVNDFLVVSNKDYLDVTIFKSLGLYGWLIVIAMFVFVIMIHKSMVPLKKSDIGTI